MPEFELPPSASPDTLFSARPMRHHWYQELNIWIAASVGFATGMLVMWFLMPAAEPLPTAAPELESLRQEVEQLQPVKDERSPRVAPRPETVVEKAKPMPLSAPAPTSPKEEPKRSAAANPAGATLTLTAFGASAAQAGITANVYVDGQLVGVTPIKARPVEPGSRIIRFDCLWEGKAYKGDDAQVEIEPNMDATIEHKCDVLVLIGTPDEVKAQNQPDSAKETDQP
jgi:hypothetical protein